MAQLTTLNTKVKLRYDTLANWQKTNEAGVGGNLVLLKGEVAFCEIPSNGAPGGKAVTDSGDKDYRPTVLFKVGDGETPFKNLPWASATAADVYSWAKAATKPSYNAGEITITDSADHFDVSTTTVEEALADLATALENVGSAVEGLDFADADATTGSAMSSGDTVVTSVTQADGQISVTKQSLGLGTAARKAVSTAAISDNSDITDNANSITPNNNLVTASQVATYIKARTAALTGATHFRGTLSAAPSAASGETDLTLPATYTVGADTVNYAAGDIVLYGTSEYIHDGTKWVLLGDEGVYATIAALNAAIDRITTLEGKVDVNSVATAIANAINGIDVDVDAGTIASGSQTEAAYFKALKAFEIEDGALKSNSVETVTLSKVAATGSIYDLTQAANTTLILDGGNSGVSAS